jgi:exodeoxyribonuclease V alpha subunit
MPTPRLMATWSGGGGTVPGMQQRRVAPSTLEAVLERITYANQETGYTVARVATDRGSDLLTVVGPLLGAQPGESLRLRGRWASHPQYGRQFQVEAYTTVLPATIQGIRRYLGSGLIRGIGPKMAERIVDHFGQDTLRLVEEAPGRLVEVPGLGPKRTAMIMTAWAEQQAIKEVMVFLQGVGVSTSLAVRIYKTFRDEAIQVVRREPYRLAAEVWGIGFKTADQLARRLGIPHDSPQRVKAGLQFALSQASEDGHCYLLEAELVANATGLLGVDTALAGRCLEELVAEEGVVAEPLPTAVSPDAAASTGRAIWLVPFRRAEVALAGGLLRLLDAPPTGWPASRRSTGRSRGTGWVAPWASPWPRAGGGGQVGFDRAGGGADRRARLWQELHRAGRGRPGPCQAGQDSVGRPDRAGRQAPVRAGRVGGGHPAPAAAAAPGWGCRL